VMLLYKTNYLPIQYLYIYMFVCHNFCKYKQTLLITINL
jgi:hypothetical protein